MGSFIKWKKQKILSVFDALGENHTEESFIETFKSMYPADWQLIQDKWAEEEKNTPIGKKHPMPEPNKYMKEMYRNWKKTKPN